MANPYISSITLPTGNTYDVKDAGARELIAELQQNAKFIGVTTTELSDGSTTNPIVIDGESVTAKAGDWTITDDGKKEFIFNGTSWQEFGDMSDLGSLAYKDSASGTVAVPTSASFTGTSKSVSVSGTTTGSVDVTKNTITISAAQSGETTYEPSGTNASSAVSASGSFKPEGTVTAPTISVKTAGGTTNVTGIATVGTLPSATMPTYTVSNEVLTITAGSFDAGTLPTKETTVACKTSDPVYEASVPTFTGGNQTVSVTGMAAAQVWSGDAVRLVTDSEVATAASFVGDTMSSTGTYQPEGSVTLTDTNKTVTVS